MLSRRCYVSGRILSHFIVSNCVLNFDMFVNLFLVTASYPQVSLIMFYDGKSSLWQIRSHMQSMSIASLHTPSCVREVYDGDVEFPLQTNYWIFQQRRHKVGSKKDAKLSIFISLGFLLRIFLSFAWWKMLVMTISILMRIYKWSWCDQRIFINFLNFLGDLDEVIRFWDIWLSVEDLRWMSHSALYACHGHLYVHLCVS